MRIQNITFHSVNRKSDDRTGNGQYKSALIYRRRYFSHNPLKNILGGKYSSEKDSRYI